MVTRVTVSEYACLIWYYHLARVVLEIGHLMPLFFLTYTVHIVSIALQQSSKFEIDKLYTFWHGCFL